MSDAMQAHFVATWSHVFALLMHVHLVLGLENCAKLNFLRSFAFALRRKVCGNQGNITHKERTVGDMIFFFLFTNSLPLTTAVMK